MRFLNKQYNNNWFNNVNLIYNLKIKTKQMDSDRERDRMRERVQQQ